MTGRAKKVGRGEDPKSVGGSTQQAGKCSPVFDTDRGTQRKYAVFNEVYLGPVPTDGGGGGVPKVDFLWEFRAAERSASVPPRFPHNIHPSLARRFSTGTRDGVAE